MSIFFTQFFFHSIFFFTQFFFTIYVPRFGKKKISHNVNYLVCFVLYDPSLDQRILLRKEQKKFSN